MKQLEIVQGKEKNLLRHHPWVFSGAIQTADLPSEACIVRVVTSTGCFIAYGWYDSKSHIPLRLLSWNEKKEITSEWWEEQTVNAIRNRSSFILNRNGDTVFRLIHGESDFLPGVAADLYDTVVRIIISARVAFDNRQSIVNAIFATLKPSMVVLNTDPSFCGIEALKEVTEYYNKDGVFTPSAKAQEILIKEDGLYYSVLPGSGQKSGFFCDQRENRKRAELYAKDRTVLDMCCYTGSFALHCLRGGAKSVDCFDISSFAVDKVMSHVLLNIKKGALDKNCINRISAQKGDAFDVLRAIPANKYNMIILDPPKLAKTAKALEEAKKGYKDLNRLAMSKICDGGILVTCSCSGALSREDFRTVLAWSAKDAACEVHVLETLGQPQDHPIRLSFPESEYLKVYILQVFKNRC